VVDISSRLLRQAGYLVTATTESRDALARFLDAPTRFDAVLTDQTMPGLTGLELAREIRRVRTDIPVLLFTGYSESTTAERVAKAGITEVVLKPAGRDRLVRAVQDSLDEKAAGRHEPAG